MTGLIYALDSVNLESAVPFLLKAKSKLSFVKLGYEFFFALGMRGVSQIAEIGIPIFLDLKMHDIPRTVQGGLFSLDQMNGIKMLTFHASGGVSMLREAVNFLKPKGIKVLAVTVLTSLNDDDLKSPLCFGGVQAEVLDVTTKMAISSSRCGVDGVVCSAFESAFLKDAVKKDCGSNFITVCPGIRFREDGISGDQKRVAYVDSSEVKQCDYIVVGRAISNHSNPIGRLEALYDLVNM